MKLISCPECETQILERLGTVCPNCGHTIGYFNESEKRPKYGKFFALSVFLPFISFILIIVTSLNKISFAFGVIFYLFVAYKSCPYLYKDLFITKFEGIFFWVVWILVNSLLVAMIYNVINKLAVT
jgi:hypothetical protein